jgi:endonuclease/exonuclease/phosphatase family metal-dependent hydrolase
MTRTFRLIESCFTALFFIQALRLVVGTLLNTTTIIVNQGRVIPFELVIAYVVLVGVILLAWLAPKRRAALPETLSIAAIIVAVARVVMVLPNTTIRLYAGFVIIGFAAVYLVSLMRANVQIWVVVTVVSFALDQLLRAYDTFDYALQVTLRGYLDVPAAGSTWRLIWIAVQAIIALLLIVNSRLARANAKEDPYRPALLSALGGIGVGAFYALEMTVLAMPNVIARWAELPFSTIVPWLLLATMLPLLPSVRVMIAQFMATFDEQLQGVIWLFAFVLLTVAGNRFDGILSAALLVVAQFMAVLLLITIPEPPNPTEVDQVGPSFSLGMIVFLIITFTFSYITGPSLSTTLAEGLYIITLIVAASLIGLPRIFVYEPSTGRTRRDWRFGGVLPAFIAPFVMVGLMLVVVPAPISVTPTSTFRVATYNINGGYDDTGTFRLESAIQDIEASLADVIILQEVDTGRTVSFGADQVEVLARRLDMYAIYQPTINEVQGVAVLSRWPIFQSSGLTFNTPAGQAAIVNGLIQNPSTGALVTIYGTQLQPGSEDERLRQFGVLGAYITETAPEDTAIILAGDFQAVPQDALYTQLINIGFTDPDQLLQVEQGFTTPASNPTFRHDYILMRGIEPLDVRQVLSQPPSSDHRLVVVEVAWP